MKVKELVKLLNKMDQELEVVRNDAEWGYFYASKPRLATDVTIREGHFTPNPVTTVLCKAVEI